MDAPRIADALATAGDGITVTSVADRTVYSVVDGVPVSILGYSHALLAPPESLDDVALPVASAEDLVAMKLAAIGNRGAAKDFWDLDTMLRAGVCSGRIDAALDRFRAKYPRVDVGFVIRALAYFDSADAEPLPVGLDVDDWVAIKIRNVERARAAFAP